MAISCELLACAMPRMLDVCITSTEKLGSQLAMRDPAREHRGISEYSLMSNVIMISFYVLWSNHQSGRSDCVGLYVVEHLLEALLGPCCPPNLHHLAAGSSPALRPH